MDLSDIVLSWYGISQGKEVDQSNVFIRFIAVYIAFNAIYDCRYSKELDPAKRIRSFSDDKEMNDRHLELLKSNAEYLDAVKYLAEKGVIDMQKKELYEINRIEYLYQVMRCVYRVRNNLFHGNKDPGEPRNIDLVGSSYVILSHLIEPWVNRRLIDEWAGA
jgi:hypothetical protein